jgi:hypothetical protein
MQYNNKREPVLDMNELTDDELFLGNYMAFLNSANDWSCMYGSLTHTTHID